MDCIHGLVSDTCKYELGGEDLWGVMVIDRPLDYTQVELDDSLWVELTLDGATYSVTVAEAGERTDNGCPSEAEYQSAWWEAMDWRAEYCELCVEARRDGADDWEQVGIHADNHETDESRPLPTQILSAVGRPAWVRVEFTGRRAGAQGVETLPTDDMEPQSLDVVPLEWDEPVETIVLPHENVVRLRWELSEQRAHRTERMGTCECPHDLGDCDSGGDCPCIVCHVRYDVGRLLQARV